MLILIYKFISIFLILVACNPIKQGVDKPINKKATSNSDAPSIINVDKYFKEHELEPIAILYNNEGIQTATVLEGHEVEWVDVQDETKVRIDSELFTLKDKVTLNEVMVGQKDSVDFVNSWEEMKLYRFNGRDLIGIKMTFKPCTGLGCSVDYYLIYDVATKSKNFFGTFRSDNSLSLYNFKNDDKVDYLAKNYDGNADGSIFAGVIYNLYSLESGGNFVQMNSPTGERYAMTRMTYPGETEEPVYIVTNWIETVK